MLHKIIHHPALAFFFLILVLVVGLRFWAPATFHPSSQATLRDRLSCQTDKFSTALLETTLAQSNGQIRMLITFDAQPDNEALARFASHNIQLYPESWVLDYLVGETAEENLCTLAADSAVSFIDIVSLQ